MYFGIYKDEIKYHVVVTEEQEFAKIKANSYLYVVKKTEYETEGAYFTNNRALNAR